MAIDEGLLRQTSSPSSPPVTYLRFYRWIRPTLSLGFSQKASRVVDLEFCKMRDIDVVRRPTGGKAVLHHHEVTYSVTSNDRRHFPCNDIGATYLKIARALADGFREMDLEVSLAPENPRLPPRLAGNPSCFATANHFEILCRGRKLVGSAQRRTRTAFLQHGSILLEFNEELLRGALGKSELGGLGSKVDGLSAFLGRAPDVSEVIRHLSKGFSQAFEVMFEPFRLPEEWLCLALDLSRSKYSSLERHEIPELA